MEFILKNLFFDDKIRKNMKIFRKRIVFSF